MMSQYITPLEKLLVQERVMKSEEEEEEVEVEGLLGLWWAQQK